MTDILPPCFALRGEMTWELPGAFTSGGQSVFGGETQVRRTDGGGGWRATLNGLLLSSADLQRTWETLWLNWNLGDTKLEVPRQGFRLRAGFVTYGSVTFGDDTTFDDGTEFEGGDGLAVTVGPIDLRSTTAQILLPAGASLRGAEPFTLVGPTYGARLYGVARILAVASDPDGDTVTVRFGPPARETYADGIPADFLHPRCTMRAVVSTDGAKPPDTRSRFRTANMVFEETFT